MAALLSAFLLGCICGLRSMTAPAVVAWGAHLGWLHLEGSLFAFFANKISLVIFSLFAVSELIADKLPFIPPRTQAGPLVVRMVFGAMCGAAICTSGASSQLLGAILGAAGGVAGAFAGYAYRRRLSRGSNVRGSGIPDLLLALLEDLVAVGGGFLLLSHL
jgi:uncharacterized membrane protein